MKKQRVRVSLFSGEQFERDWPPGNASKFVAWLEKKIAMAPAEYRDKVEIEINSRTFYDSDCATIEIAYTRMETDEEMNGRIKAAAIAAEYTKAAELEMLHRLKVKYEGGA